MFANIRMKKNKMHSSKLNFKKLPTTKMLETRKKISQNKIDGGRPKGRWSTSVGRWCTFTPAIYVTLGSE